jgi:hypothetical protein
LTDTVRCSFDSAHTFTCEVDMGPDPSPAVGSSQPAPGPSAPPALDPAVSALVGSYTRVVLPTPDVPYLTGKALADCASSEAGVFLALAATAGPLAAVAAFKIGFDEGKCIAVEHNNATTTAGQQEAAADCASRGGAVSEVNGDTTVCEVQVSR